jgi:hypothetical protein
MKAQENTIQEEFATLYFSTLSKGKSSFPILSKK